MTSKQLLLGAAVVASLGLAAAPASAAHRGVGGHGGPAIHGASGMGAAHFASRGRIGTARFARGYSRGWDRGRAAHAQIGWGGGWRRGGWGRGWGWGGGWGLGAGVGLGLAAATWGGGWGDPGYYDYYDTDYYDTAPAVVGVGFGPGWGGWGGWGGGWGGSWW